MNPTKASSRNLWSNRSLDCSRKHPNHLFPFSGATPHSVASIAAWMSSNPVLFPTHVLYHLSKSQAEWHYQIVYSYSITEVLIRILFEHICSADFKTPHLRIKRTLFPQSVAVLRPNIHCKKWMKRFYITTEWGRETLCFPHSEQAYGSEELAEGGGRAVPQYLSSVSVLHLIISWGGRTQTAPNFLKGTRNTKDSVPESKALRNLLISISNRYLYPLSDTHEMYVVEQIGHIICNCRNILFSEIFFFFALRILSGTKALPRVLPAVCGLSLTHWKSRQ